MANNNNSANSPPTAGNQPPQHKRELPLILVPFGSDGANLPEKDALNLDETVENHLYSGLKSMKGLKLGKNTTRLVIAGQPLNTVEGLDTMPQLYELWISESELKEGPNLRAVPSLISLTLTGNQIKKMQPLSYLPQLTLIRMEKNQITSFRDFGTLPSLKRLYVDGNCIHHLSDLRFQFPRLEVLSLSGNPITSLKELSRLGTLPCLKEVNVAPGPCGECPVFHSVLLNHYMTYHLPSLERIGNGMDVGPEEKKEAIDFLTQRKLIYQAEAQDVWKKQALAERTTITEHHRRINALRERLYQLMAAQVRMRDGSRMKSKEDVRNWYLKVQARIDRICKKVASFEEERMVSTINLKAEAQLKIQYLNMELENVGNVGLEKLLPGSNPYHHCSALMAEFFCHQEYMKMGITGYNILEISGVKNAVLNKVFESRKMDQALVGMGDYKLNHVEIGYALLVPPAEYDSSYLSLYTSNAEREKDCVWPPMWEDELTWVLRPTEHGFYPRTEKYPAPSWLFTDCLAHADWRWVKDWRQYQASKEHARTTAASLLDGGVGLSVMLRRRVALLVKIIINDMAPCNLMGAWGHSDDVYVQDRRKPSAQSSQDSQEGVEDGEKEEEDADWSSMYRNNCGHWKLRKGCVFSAVPAYLVRYEYTGSTQTLPAILPSNDDELLQFSITYGDKQKKESIKFEIFRKHFSSKLTELVLSGLGFNEMGPYLCQVVGSMPNLRFLDLSYNELTCLAEFPRLENLERLKLTANHFTTLCGMTVQPSLTMLDVDWNFITCMALAGRHIASFAPSVRQVRLAHNPIQDITHPDLQILYLSTSLPHLMKIDGFSIQSQFIHTEAYLCPKRRDRMIQDLLPLRMKPGCPVSYHSEDHPMSLSLLCGAQRATYYCISNGISNIEYPTSVCLDCQRLMALPLGNSMASVKWLSACRNCLSSEILRGLPKICPQLEELSLSWNIIDSLSFVSGLINLVSLDLKFNLLLKLDSLMTSTVPLLPSLKYLDVSNNVLQSLTGLSHCPSLRELYASNNHLSELPPLLAAMHMCSKLEILDLSGNGVTTMVRYRIRMIYHLRSLRLLDGKSVEDSALAQAKKDLGGRLDVTMLAVTIGERDKRAILKENLHLPMFAHVTKLNLPDSGLYHIEVEAMAQLSNLRTMDLSRNFLTSFWQLCALPSLRKLNLTANRLDGIGTEVLRCLLCQVAASSTSGRKSKCLHQPFAKLQVLLLGRNLITSLKSVCLHMFPRVTVLFLEGNSINSVEGAGDLIYLEKLILDNNYLESLPNYFLASSVKLQYLFLEDNRFRSIPRVTHLHALRYLFLACNRIKDVKQIRKLEGTSLIELSMSGNPIARNCGHELFCIGFCPSLKKLDGCEVTAEKRESLKSGAVPRKGSALKSLK